MNLEEMYREKMIKALIEDGKWLIANAEKIMIGIRYNTGLTITIDYSQPTDYIPIITIKEEYINPAAILEINRREDSNE